MKGWKGPLELAFWTFLILGALSLALRSQTITVNSDGSICGGKFVAAHTDLIQVSCPDFDRLRKLSNLFILTGTVTQVLVHARGGDTVYISVDGGRNYQRHELRLDSERRLVALAQFSGSDYTQLSVKVVSELK